MPELIQSQLDHLFRHESGKMVPVLSRLLGLQHMDKAEDLVQDTLLQAMHSWAYGGIPENPSAWLYRVARNKAIDLLRRERKFREISPQYSYLLQSEYTIQPTVDKLFDNDGIEDSQLRMIFACCHPSIPAESQIALALKTLCGLSIAEIARSFLTSEETISKRIYRAREKIRTECIELDMPSAGILPLRLDNVLRCLYLLFSEGYNSSHPDKLIREELCEEAMRLIYKLTRHQQTNLPSTNALMALACFQASRLKARLDDEGHIILLKYQDRSKWFLPLMEKGVRFMKLAIQSPFETSGYHLEAAIAALHAGAPSFEKTDWKSVYSLYEQLHHLQPSPIIALNKAIACSYARDKQEALQEMLRIEGLEHYHLYHASLGELYFEMGEKFIARRYFEKALKYTLSKAEQQLINERIEQCNQGSV